MFSFKSFRMLLSLLKVFSLQRSLSWFAFAIRICKRFWINCLYLFTVNKKTFYSLIILNGHQFFRINYHIVSQSDLRYHSEVLIANFQNINLSIRNSCACLVTFMTCQLLFFVFIRNKIFPQKRNDNSWFNAIGPFPSN